MLGISPTAPQGHLFNAMQTLSSSMNASVFQFRLAAENMSNWKTTGTTPGSTPYQRKLVTLKNETERKTGASLVAIQKVSHDTSDFREEYIPNHPAANEEGVVLFPNVDPTIEAIDAQNANISLRTASALYKLSSDMVRRVNGLIDSTKG